MSEPWRPRPHDDLVEPLLGGLGCTPERSPRPRRSRKRAALALALLALGTGLVAWLLSRLPP